MKTQKFDPNQAPINLEILSKCSFGINGAFTSQNEFHFIDYQRHLFKYNVVNKNITKIEHNLVQMECPRLLYIASKNYLMIFGGSYSNSILCCDLGTDLPLSQYEWKYYDMRMPQTVANHIYDVLHVFDNIILIFYWHSHDNDASIYFLDLLFNETHQVTKYKVPTYFNYYLDEGNIYAFKDRNNSIHIIHFTDGYHVKFNIFDIMPDTLQMKHRKHYQSLVFGYIRQMQNKSIVSNIPDALKRLILKYFPTFL